MAERGDLSDWRDDETDEAEPPERGEIWARGGYALLFLIAFEIAQAVMNLMAIVQFAVLLIWRRRNRRIERFGRSLALWQAQASAFLSGATDTRPFPFRAWPDPDA